MKVKAVNPIRLVALALVVASCGGGSGSGSGAGGTTGAAGTTGSAGTTGAAGTAAAAGTTGAAGTAAAAGTTGAAGTAAAGTSGSAGTTGAAGRGGNPGNAGAPGNAGRGGSTGNAGTTGNAGATGTGGAASPMMNFFVTSDTDTDADLGGLSGADARCQRLAAAVGAGSKTWRAYLSAANPATNARDRIGEGPYYNSQGAMLAATKAALHARSGDPALFIDEHGARINGQWSGSPSPNQHDILTGSTLDGTISTGNTCGDWTATTGNSFVGHSDGLGPSMSSDPPYNQWAGAHTGQCGNTQPGGGAGRLYCFVGP